MSFTVTAGYYFGATETLTSSKLHTLIEGANITSLAETMFETATSRPIESKATDPLMNYNGKLWFDESIAIMRQRRNTRYEALGYGQVFTNDTGATIPQGAVVVPEASYKMSMVVTAAWRSCAGVLLATVADGGSGLIAAVGIQSVLVTGVINTLPGDILVSSGLNDGHAASASNAGVSLTDLVPHQDVGMALTTLAGSGLVTALLWM